MKNISQVNEIIDNPHALLSDDVLAGARGYAGARDPFGGRQPPLPPQSVQEWRAQKGYTDPLAYQLSAVAGAIGDSMLEDAALDGERLDQDTPANGSTRGYGAVVTTPAAAGTTGTGGRSLPLSCEALDQLDTQLSQEFRYETAFPHLLATRHGERGAASLRASGGDANNMHAGTLRAFMPPSKGQPGMVHVSQLGKDHQMSMLQLGAGGNLGGGGTGGATFVPRPPVEAAPQPPKQEQWQEKIYIDELLGRPLYGANAMSRILGKSGYNHKRMESETGARVFFRGFGLSSDLSGAGEDSNNLALMAQDPNSLKGMKGKPIPRFNDNNTYSILHMSIIIGRCHNSRNNSGIIIKLEIHTETN